MAASKSGTTTDTMSKAAAARPTTGNSSIDAELHACMARVEKGMALLDAAQAETEVELIAGQKDYRTIRTLMRAAAEQVERACGYASREGEL